MAKVRINFRNVEVKIKRLRDNTEQCLETDVKNGYAELKEILSDAEGEFTTEMINVLLEEEQAVLQIAQYFKKIYALIQKSSNEFEGVDLAHGKALGDFANKEVKEEK